MTKAKTRITVTMTSDYICPWCLIGEKRLQDAIAQLPNDVSVDVRLRPYELNPEMQKEGMDRKVYRSLKFGSWERSQQLDAATVAAGKADGVPFNYDSIERTPNTFAAHKLTRWAQLQGRGSDVAHRILKAYFVQGRDIGDTAVLSAIAGEAGLDANAAHAHLEDPATDADTRHDITATATHGVAGVPQFDIEGATIRGAQPAEVLRDAILSAARAKASTALADV